MKQTQVEMRQKEGRRQYEILLEKIIVRSKSTIKTGVCQHHHHFSEIAQKEKKFLGGVKDP